MRLQRIRDGTLGRPPGAPAPIATESSSKKRKADDGEEDADVEGRKKVKGAEMVNGLPAGFFDEGVDPTNGKDEDVEEVAEPADTKQTNQASETAIQVPEQPAPEPTAPQTSSSALPSNFFDHSSNPTPIDESEWAAFERDIATPSPTLAPTALTASATISAAPLSAAELAARSAEEANLQRKDRKAAEMEGEKEDAARQLDEEFDEMEELENRVRRLREKREALRRRRDVEAGEVVEGEGGVESQIIGTAEGAMAIPIRMNGGHDTGQREVVAMESEEDEEDEDGEDGEDWDAWMGGLR